MADETSVPSSAQAKRTIKIKPLAFRRPAEAPTGNSAGTSILPNPASTQANPAAVIPQTPSPVETVQNVGAATAGNLAQKTLKLAPPTRTGVQRPSPVSTVVPAAPVPVSVPDAGRTQSVTPIPHSPATASAPEPVHPVHASVSGAAVRDIARQTIKIAPPTRTGAQRPSPIPSVTPSTPPTLDSVRKNGPITLQESSISVPDAARTQAVRSPVSGESTDAAKKPTVRLTPLKTNATGSTVSGGGSVPVDAKKPTVHLKPLTAPAASPAVSGPVLQELSPQEDAVPKLKPQAVDQSAPVELPSTEIPKPGSASPVPEPETDAEKAAETGPETSVNPPKSPVPDLDDSSASEEAETEPETDASAEPGTVFMIFSLVSLLVLLLTAYILVAQFGGMWLSDFPNLPLPGLK